MKKDALFDVHTPEQFVVCDLFLLFIMIRNINFLISSEFVARYQDNGENEYLRIW